MTDATYEKGRRSGLSRLALTGLALAVCGLAVPAQAQDDDEALEEIVVKGFRGSLQASLQQKREATGQIDAITATDIADFPDLNLAEALQRIPGVAITRSGGEGNRITVRGLSGRFSQTRLNGMETRAAVAGNASRAFDFNMFASELFNSLVVHKTASGALSEGSLGAVVDLNTSDPFNFDEGTTMLLSAKGAYNNQVESTKPRIAALYGYRTDTWGVNASLAYSEAESSVNTSNNVRWQKARFNSVLGQYCPTSAEINDPVNPIAQPAACAEVEDAFHARIPRYGEEIVNRERLGLTLGLQFRPTDRTEISVDGLFATFDQERDFKTIEVLFRSNEGGMDVTDYSIVTAPGTNRDGPGGGNNTIVSMDVDNAWVRSETYNQNAENTFSQISATLKHEFSDSLWMDALIGTSDSEGLFPNSTTLMYDDRDYNGYSYSYATPSDPYPVLAFNGPDVTDPTNFTLTELRDQVHKTDTGYDNFALNLHWEFSEAATLSGGFEYKKASMDTEQDRRDGSACAPGPGGVDCDLDDDGTNDILGPQGTAANSDPFTYGGTVGAGSNTTWASPSLVGWTTALDYYNSPLRDDQGRTRAVEEKNTGVWLQLAGEMPAGDMRFVYDLGVRYVETEQSSSGFNSGVWVTVDRPKYDDTLPSGNAALWVTDDFVLRASAAQVMSRPALSNLSPGGSVDSFNFRISFQNPNLDPTRADVFDLSAEWYFADESLVSLAFFSKDIESFPLRSTDMGTFASTGLPMSVISPTSPASQTPEGTCGDPAGCWEITQLGNGPGAKLDGWELSFQAPFSELFGSDAPIFSDMGVIANYTSIDSSFDFNFNGTTVTSSLIGQSDSSYNATVYYENDVFGARVSVANRSDYNVSGPDRSNNLWQYQEDATYVDLSAKYIVNDNLTLTLEVLNLTDEESDFFVDIDAERRLESYQTGTNFLLGARYTFD